MRTFLKALVVAVILMVAYEFLSPTIERALYAMRLVAMPKPQMLPVPVEGVRPRALRDTWGGARSAGRKHEGIDIFARRGTPVLSSTEGIVTQVGTNRLGGLVVWVMGPGGQRHYYAHLDRYADVQAGMRIEAGRVLGYVGDSGNAKGTPPHLHYGVYDVGGAINPYPLLRCTAAKTEASAPQPDCPGQRDGPA
ncbi:M23 family metallopeptidase [Pseudoduganella umbonata]|uniref:M23 family metallopeptidase n=1 Tax=Pseudoduganella umbonata TaxID=864828 RepID=A0A4V1ED97_9BURK|nr:M23 family metallopeptidase [Pseudoduganella umbonata]MBB3221128.1 murein DD-endopeptidase MepM/ murein hydrolase activator NlpD [Pseudoduganella umbonata]QCP10321.1 M23 family metallopeptidase [Pseudoduganella umbonata]